MFLQRSSIALAIAATMLFACGCADTHQITVQREPAPRGQTLPIEFVSNLPVITADANGTPVRLIVDIGGHDALALKHQIVGRIASLTEFQRRQLSYDASGQVSIDREIIVPRLTIGDLDLINVHGRSIKLPDALASQIDGYIGAAFLEHFILFVDYPARFVLYPREHPPEIPDLAQWIEVRVSPRRTSPGTLDGRAVTIGWDSGASHTVIDNDLAKDMYGSTTGEVMGAIAFGGHDFGAIKMRVIELRGAQVDLLLGHNFFMAHRVLFDFAKRTAWVEPER